MEETVKKIIEHHFHEVPVSIERMTMGICNEVYAAHFKDKEVIVRLSTREQNLIGSHYYTPIFKALGIKVPDMLAEDYGKSLVPYYYQVQERIKGTDLGNVVQVLTNEQLKSIAKDIAAVINKIKTIPSTEKFGPVWGNGGEFSDTWTERMRLWTEETIERGGKTGVIDKPLADLANKLYETYVPYFNSVMATTYYGDMCSKNVMIADGKFSGLVDLDALTQGDPLEAVGRMKTSWYGTTYGKVYSDAVMDELGLNDDQRKVVTAYALMSALAWTAENGIKFNENTTAVVDKQKEIADKERVRGLASELGIN